MKPDESAEKETSEDASDSEPEDGALPDDEASDDEVPEDDDEPRDSVVEVEPETIDSKPKQAPSHLPPPPPSIRARGSTSHLEIDGKLEIASDLMTKKIFTIEPDDVIANLEQQMEAFRFRHLPVVRNKKLVGLITHSDLLHASSSFLSPVARKRDEVIHKLPAHRIMQTEVITVRPTDKLSEVAHLMWEARIGCVLVTEEDGTVVGIITEGDFIRVAHHFLTRDSDGGGSAGS